MLLLMILTFFLNCSDTEKTKEVESRAWRDITPSVLEITITTKCPTYFDVTFI